MTIARRPGSRAARAVVVLAAAATLLATYAVGVAGAAPGGLDTAFGGGGRVTRQLGLGGHEGSSHALAMAVAPDGRVVVGGTATDPELHPSFMAARFTPDGRPDETFGDAGRIILQAGSGILPYSQATGIALAPDGGVVLAGNATDAPAHPAVALVKLLVDGTPDPAFGTGGVVRAQLGSDTSQAFAVDIDATGRILVAGDADDGDGRPALAVARFSPAGALDESFGSAGRTVVQLGNGGAGRFSAGTSIAALPGGGLLVGGEASDSRGNQQMALLRLSQSGALDTSFAARGVARLQMGSGVNGFSTIRALTLAPDGGILVAGEATGRAADEQLTLVRYLPGGSLDPRFGTRGRVRAQLGLGDSPLSTARTVAIAPRGQILVGGEATDDIGDGLTLLARFSGRGVLDRSFGTLGAARRQFGAGGPGHHFSAIRASAVVDGSRLVVAGYATDPSTNDMIFLGRYVGGRRAVALVDAGRVPLAGQRARIPLLCVGPPGERCAGRLAITVPTSTAPGSGRKGRVPIVVGKARFRLVTSKVRTVEVTLSPLALRRFARKRRLEAQWRISSVDRAGNRSSFAVPLTIVPAR